MKTYIATLCFIVFLSLFVLLSDIRYLFYCSNFAFDNEDDKSDSIPVIYIHFNTKSYLPQYLADAIEISVSHGNNVTLITQPTNVKHFHGCAFENLWHYNDNPELFRFRIQYDRLFEKIHTIGDNEWEFNNMERFFILKSFMIAKKISKVFYVDSDAVLLTRIRESIFKTECNAYFSYETKLNHYNNYHWVVWAGMALINLDTLESFLKFNFDLISNQSFWPVLALKDYKKPYVCDMTLWYLFTAKYDEKLMSAWKWPRFAIENLPNVDKKGTVCNINELGFDHNRGHTMCLSLKSYHFQGREKNAITYLKPHLLKKKIT